MIYGINLDLYNRLGHPAPARLKGIKYARLPYNVSYNPDNDTRGNRDTTATFNRYNPYLTALQGQGLTPILILTHQTYGEGNVNSWIMNDSQWFAYITGPLSQVVREIAQQYKGRNYTYEIWNEQDAPVGAEYAVNVPAHIYGLMFRELASAIRSIDPTAKIITGGFLGGAGDAAAYYKIANIKNVCDGVSVHPYGQGSRANPDYVVYGYIGDYLSIWKSAGVVPIITEWSVLNANGEPVDRVRKFASDFASEASQNGVSTCIWYAWADGMDNGYGVVDGNDQVKSNNGQTLLSLFLADSSTPDTPEGFKYLVITGGVSKLTLRAFPTVQSTALGMLYNRLTPVKDLGESQGAGGYNWRKIEAFVNGRAITGWFAAESSTWKAGLSFFDA